MIIAIAADGNVTSAHVDERFGRCSYFAFYDTESDKVEFKENPNKEADHGAGPASVSFIAKNGARKVVSGEFGMKIKDMMDELGIGMIVMKHEKTVREIIEAAKNNI